jgi:2-dehydro-3-deoxyphosphogluconate aldolase/(4S)-4-hydroxy-2-oxoglutarate aldolase
MDQKGRETVSQAECMSTRISRQFPGPAFRPVGRLEDGRTLRREAAWREVIAGRREVEYFGFLPLRPRAKLFPMKKDAILSKIKSEKVIALIRANSPDGLLDCARALAAGGLTSIELTMTTPGAIRMLEKATTELPDFMFGLGTVLDAETARMGILSGARFIVTPALRPEVITLCRRYSVPVFCGAFTPTEILNAWEAGADAAKIFPAEFFGPGYIKSVKAPLPHVEMVPTGGVNEQNVGEFLKAGAFATAAGSSLVDAKALKEKNWEAITAKAKAFAAAAAAAK